VLHGAAARVCIAIHRCSGGLLVAAGTWRIHEETWRGSKADLALSRVAIASDTVIEDPGCDPNAHNASVSFADRFDPS